MGFADGFWKVVLDEEEWYCREREGMDDCWSRVCWKYEGGEPTKSGVVEGLYSEWGEKR